MYKETLGIVGGFGAYATLNFYKRLLEEFSSDSERNYPHIIMDNNFTMPSRTRALLYNEAYDQVITDITESIKMLVEKNASKIVLVCGTAHYFLDDIYEILPDIKDRIVNIIHVLGEELQEQRIDHVFVIAAEGALEKNIYINYLKKYGIGVEQPVDTEYTELRYFIECVKQSKLCEEVADRFVDFLAKRDVKNIVLGCTEFPILVQYINNISSTACKIGRYSFFDPLELTISRLKKILT